MSFADLHLHTNFSDGTFTPEELVSQPEEPIFQAGRVSVARLILDLLNEPFEMACPQNMPTFTTTVQTGSDSQSAENTSLGFPIEASAYQCARFHVFQCKEIHDLLPGFKRCENP